MSVNFKAILLPRRGLCHHKTNDAQRGRSNCRPIKNRYQTLRCIGGRSNSVAELGSALCSAASQNLAAVGSRHSLAEAVLFLALTLLGLISAKHDTFLLSFLCSTSPRAARAEMQLTICFSHPAFGQAMILYIIVCPHVNHIFEIIPLNKAAFAAKTIY